MTFLLFEKIESIKKLYYNNYIDIGYKITNQLFI